MRISILTGKRAHDRLHRRLTSLAEIEAVAEAWRGLEQRCGDRLSYFQSFDWCRCWVAAFSGLKEAPEFRVETLWIGDQLVAVWPLMVQTMGGIRVLQNLGAPHSQYSNLICAEADLAAGVAEELIARIRQAPGCDVAVFYPVPEPSALSRLLNGHPTIQGFDNSSAVLDLTEFADSAAFRAQGGKLKKRNRNRRRNHLARLGELEFEAVWPSDPRFGGLVRKCVAMKRRWLKETGRPSSGFALEGYDDFLVSLPGDAMTLSGACLFVLRAGDRVVACELGFLRNGHYYAYIGSFDWDLRALSPGKVQMEMTVCWLIDQGVSAYDLLGMPAEYKQSWSNRLVALQGYSLPFSWKGRLYAQAWLPILRPTAKRLYFAMPDSLRRLLSGVQGFGFLLLYV